MEGISLWTMITTPRRPQSQHRVTGLPRNNKNGTIDNASKVTKGKGSKIVEAVVEGTCAFLTELSKI